MSKAGYRQLKCLSDCLMISCVIIANVNCGVLSVLEPCMTCPRFHNDIRHKVMSKLMQMKCSKNSRPFRLNQSPHLPVVIFSRWANGNNNAYMVISLLCPCRQRDVISLLLSVCSAFTVETMSSWRLWSCAIIR